MNHSTQKGFTLVETLVAVAILASAIVGPFVAIHTALNASYSARDHLVATMLAQEGIEYVRGVRDSNYLYKVQNPTVTRSWLFGIDGTGASPVDCRDMDPTDSTPKRCTVDPTGNTPVALCAGGGMGTCSPLNFAPSVHLYTQASPSGYRPSVYTRYISLSPVGTDEMQVTSTVTFTSAHKSYTVTLTERLANWL